MSRASFERERKTSSPRRNLRKSCVGSFPLLSLFPAKRRGEETLNLRDGRATGFYPRAGKVAVPGNGKPEGSAFSRSPRLGGCLQSGYHWLTSGSSPPELKAAGGDRGRHHETFVPFIQAPRAQANAETVKDEKRAPPTDNEPRFSFDFNTRSPASRYPLRHIFEPYGQPLAAPKDKNDTLPPPPVSPD